MPTLDKQLLDRIRHNDPNLTTLDLNFNQISAAGAKGLSLALKDNTTLTMLHLVGNQIGNACLQEIHSFIQRNTQALLKRRQEFIYKMILLARDAKNPHSNSLWRRLPNDMRLFLLSFLNFRGETTIGKTTMQIVHCAQFIFAKGDECNGLIKAKQKIQIIEAVDITCEALFKLNKEEKRNANIG